MIFDFLTGLSWILVPILTTLTAINLATARTIHSKNVDPIDSSVAILIPMRNEAANVHEVLDSATNQQDLTNLKVLVLDDQSSDGTTALLEAQSNPRIQTFRGEDLPRGWLGKNFAAHQIASKSDAEYLVFIDADVRLSQYAIASSIAMMNQLNLDFLSPYPRQIAISWLERLVQPLLQWSWFVSVPLRLSEKFPRRSMAVANGQFFLVRASAYRISGGHEAIKSEVLDDIELARLLISKGFRGTVADGSKIAHCRMYSSPKELIAGYAKSQWRAFGNIPGSALMALILLCSSIIPLIAGLLGLPWGWIGFFAIVATRLAVAAKTQSVISSAWLHPLSALAWIALIKYSWIQKWRGALVWKDRKV